MLPQETREALEVVADYKTFNQHTIKKVAKRCKITKAVYYETVAVDINGGKFLEKYRKKEKEKKLEKHLGKQLMGAPKKIKLPKPPKPRTTNRQIGRIYVKTGTSEAVLDRREEMFLMLNRGKTYEEISELKNISVSTVKSEISAYRKANNIKPTAPTREAVKELLLQKKSVSEICKAINKTKATVLHHIDMLIKENPKLAANRIKPRIPLTIENIAVKDLFEKGYTLSQIGKILNKKNSTVAHHQDRIKMLCGGDWIIKVRKAQKDKLNNKFKNEYK